MTTRALRFLIVSLGALGWQPQPAVAQRHGRLIARIDSLAAQTLRRGPVPGLSVAVQRGKERILARGYGLSRLEDSTAASELTVYPVGSITKLFTAAAVMRLVEQKKVRLKGDVSTYVPELTPASPPVTIQHLLSHTSGFAALESLDSDASPDVISPDDVVTFFQDTQVQAAPGERFAYSNAGYYLLGLIVERVTGRPLFEHFEEDFFRPLGMPHTGDCLDAAAVATGHDSSGAPVPRETLRGAPAYAAAGACSTVVDLVLWHQALQQNRVFNRLSWHLATEPAELKDGSRVNYGLGAFLGRLGKHRSVSHGGSRPGFSAHVAYYPDDRLTVAVLANSDQAPTRRLADQIAGMVLGVVEPKVKDRLLSAAELARYVGEYDLKPRRLRIVAGTERLRAVMGAGGELELLYQGSHEFVAESDPTLRFVFRMSGPAAGSVLFRAGELDVVADRVPSGAP